MFQEFKGLCFRSLKRFRVVFQLCCVVFLEFKVFFSRDSGLCYGSFSVVFQEIQCCVSVV